MPAAATPARVALVAASPSIVGGHSVQAAMLRQGLAADGIAVDWIPIDRALPRLVRRVPVLRTMVNEVAYVAALTRLHTADVVHIFSASYWSFLLAPVPAMAMGRLMGKRVVLHYHSGEIADHLANWGWRVHPWLGLADRLVVCSAFQRDVFAAFGRSATVVPNVVDTTRFAFRPRLPIQPRFVCTRNLEPHYGIDVVLDAFARIHAAIPAATLVIAGRGSQEGRLRRHARRIGESAVSFAGSVPPADMPALLDDADIYLNASTIDNQPVSLIEAQSAGLPVITTDTGGIGEFVRDGETGVLIAPGDGVGMAAAALALIEDPARADRLARAARRATDRFGWGAARSAWLDIYGWDEAAIRQSRAAALEGPA